MKRRDLLLGGGLAAALIAGIVWTGGSGSRWGSGPPVVLDLTEADGAFELDDLRVEVTASSRPLRVFEPLRFAFRFTRKGEPVSVVEPRIDFTMVMDMGPHGYRLVRGETDAWIAEDVVLPQCGSGSRLWFGDLSFEAEGRKRAVRLGLELDPPRAD